MLFYQLLNESRFKSFPEWIKDDLFKIANKIYDHFIIQNHTKIPQGNSINFVEYLSDHTSVYLGIINDKDQPCFFYNSKEGKTYLNLSCLLNKIASKDNKLQTIYNALIHETSHKFSLRQPNPLYSKRLRNKEDKENHPLYFRQRDELDAYGAEIENAIRKEYSTNPQIKQLLYNWIYKGYPCPGLLNPWREEIEGFKKEKSKKLYKKLLSKISTLLSEL